MASDVLKSRTDAKLRYAALHVEELRQQPAGRGHDFERAHQEACLAQLFGAYAALLQELNVDLRCGLATKGLTPGKMRKALEAEGRSSSTLRDLYLLEQDRTSWFRQAKDARDYTSHISGIPLTHNIGGRDDGVTSLRNPETNAELPGDATDTLAAWVSEMEKLVETIRHAAAQP